MQEMKRHLLKLRADAEECSRNSKLAADPQKRELFAKLAQHFNVLASEVARAIAGQSATTPSTAHDVTPPTPTEVVTPLSSRQSGTDR